MPTSPSSKPKVVSISHTPESLAGQAVAASLSEVASALRTQTGEAKLLRLQQKPMHDFYEKADNALECAGNRLRKWGPWGLALTPFVISFINGFSPQAAKLIQALVTALGNIPTP